MKKVFLFSIALAMLAACAGKSSKPSGGEGPIEAGDADGLTVGGIDSTAIYKHSEAYIRQRIDTIYKTVGKTTLDAEGNVLYYVQNGFNRDSAYCSERYYALMQQALQVCEETGDVLYDYDYWVCGQDYSEDWSYKVARVYDVTDSTAFVDLLVHNFSDRETTIALRYERDDWFIDDFCPSDDGEDDKAYLRRVIEQGNGQ